MPIEFPDKTEYTIDKPSFREDVFIPTGADLRTILLDGHEALTIDPILLHNKTFLSQELSSTIQTIGEYYQIDVRMGNSILTSGLFSKKQVDLGISSQWAFYHAGGKYTLTLQKNASTGVLEAIMDQEIMFTIDGLPAGITATYLPDEKKLRLAESRNKYQVIEVSSLTDTAPLTIPCNIGGIVYLCVFHLKGSLLSAQLILGAPEQKEVSTAVPITSLSGMHALPWKQLQCTLVEGKIIRSDRLSGSEIGSISPDVYQAYIQQPRSVYKHPEVVFDGTTPYLLSVQFFGNQRAEITVEYIQRPILGVQKEVSYSPATATQLSGMTTQWIGSSNRKESKILLKKNETSVGTIDFKQFPLVQKDLLQQRDPLTQKDLPKISGTMTIEGKPVVFSLSNDEGVIMVSLSPYNESTDDIIRVRPQVETTERTIGVRRTKPIFSTTGAISGASLELIGTKGVIYIVDTPTLKKLGTHGASLVINKKLQNNITYKITLKNIHDELQFSLDQQDGFLDGGMEEIWEKDKQPLPDLPKPPPEVLPPEEHDDEHDDFDHQGHEEYEPEIVVVNPWGKERAEPSNPMLLEGETIDGFYKNPRLLPGSGPLDLSEVYMQPGKGFIFRLREDDRIFDNDLLTIPLDKIKLGTIIKLTGEDGKTRKVRVDIFDKKLAFSIASPGFKREGAPELIDGVPVLYTPCYPPGVRTAGIKMTQPDGTPIRGKTGTSRSAHGGLDIAGPRSTDILAATGGEVVYVKDGVPNNTPDKFGSDGYAGKKSGYGNTVVILHPGGYVTSYHHLSPGTISVKPGDKIPAGEKIAKMGNSGQVRSSKKDGTHLHLAYYKLDEAYIQAVRDANRPELFKESHAKKSAGFRWLDPEMYLRDAYTGVSPSPSPKPSPPTPEIKRTSRNWIPAPEAKPFPNEVIGSTPEQRLKSFVTYMGYNEALIRRLSIKHNIDPALMPAIIRAEHGKGPPANNNPGNVVGIDPKSLEEGLTKMAEVFSNSYQKQNTTIGSLNGYGRRLAGMPACTVDGQYCYATDMSGAWYNNVTNFMSFVYDTKIDHAYTFRRTGEMGKRPVNKEYLTSTPAEYVVKKFLFDQVSYNSYMPKLSPPIGQDPQFAPWGWLISIENDKVLLVTSSGTYPLSSRNVVVDGVSYTVRAVLNMKDPLYPRAAQFSLTPKE